MAKQVGSFFITGTIDQICFYRMDGSYYARAKSSLDGKRVKKAPAFMEMMRYAEQDSKETIGAITTNDLYIRDLGYITSTYLSAIVEKKAFFLNRLLAMAGIYNTQMKPLD